MKRREFITLLGCAAAIGWPLAARAQQPAPPVIGVLITSSRADSAERMDAFRDGLKTAGFVEGRNVTVEPRWADNQFDRLSALLNELIRRKVAVIFITGDSVVAVPLAKAATQSIPIVFTTGSDPVVNGLVTSINRPGGNVTGVSQNNDALVGKRLELLHEALPRVTKIALLEGPANSAKGNPETQEVQSVANRLGLEVLALAAQTAEGIDRAFASAARFQAGALFLENDAYFTSRREQIATLARRDGLPIMSAARESTVAGALMSYSPNPGQGMLQAGVYVGRILKGEKVGDLPVIFPTKFELVINLKTAKALGLTIPEGFLLRADELIE